MVYRIKPWYRRTGNLKKCLARMNAFVQNPFISPLLAESVKDFNHIPLYLYPLTFDAFLDDSIEMAKRWQKDKVKVEILDDLPHGFLNFVEFDAMARLQTKMLQQQQQQKRRRRRRSRQDNQTTINDNINRGASYYHRNRYRPYNPMKQDQLLHYQQRQRQQQFRLHHHQ